MPGFDRTGPEGQGSQTGRRLGRCNPNTKERETNEQTGVDEYPRGMGMRRGRGRSNSSRFGGGKGQGRGFGRRNS